MAVDYGLIGGIGQGLEKGLLAYTKQKQLTRENQIQDLTSGVTTDEDGNVKLTPEMQAKRQAGLLNDQRTIAEASGTSPETQSLQNFYGSQGIKGTENLTGSQLKEVGAPALAAAQTKATLAAALAAQKAQTGQGKADKADLWKFSDRLSKDPEIMGANKAAEAAGHIEPLLKQNTSASVLLSKVAALRSSGLNRITNFEIQNFNGDKSAQGRFEQALETLKNGDLTPGNVEQIRAAAKVFADSAKQIKANKLNQYKDLAEAVGMDPGKVELLMRQPMSQLSQEAPSAAQSTTPGGVMGSSPYHAMTDAEIEALYQKRVGGQ